MKVLLLILCMIGYIVASRKATANKWGTAFGVIFATGVVVIFILLTGL